MMYLDTDSKEYQELSQRGRQSLPLFGGWAFIKKKAGPVCFAISHSRIKGQLLIRAANLGGELFRQLNQSDA